MSRLAELLDDSNEAGIGFLMAELDMALTFLSVADTTHDEITALRNRENAQMAFESVKKHQNKVHFATGEKTLFDEKFFQVKRGLQDAGYAI